MSRKNEQHHQHCTCQTRHPCINQSINQSIHQPTHPSIHPSINRSAGQLINQPNLNESLTANQSINEVAANHRKTRTARSLKRPNGCIRIYRKHVSRHQNSCENNEQPTTTAKNGQSMAPKRAETQFKPPTLANPNPPAPLTDKTPICTRPHD